MPLVQHDHVVDGLRRQGCAACDVTAPAETVRAATAAAGQHPATEAILKFFEYDHLPSSLKPISARCADVAHDMARELDGPELTAGLRKLLEAKDCFVRAALAKEWP